MEQWFMETVAKWVISYVSQYPIFSTVILAMGFLRLSLKPLMTMAQAFVKMTPYDSDDQWLQSFEQSKGYKMFVFLLDWLLSVKLPEKPKQ